MRLSLAGPSGVGLGCALRCLACEDPVTDASGFPYRPPFDGGLGRCTSPFRSEHATPGARACVRVPAFWAGLGGLASRARFGAPHLLLTYDFSSCFFPKLQVMHFQKSDIKLYTEVLLSLCFLNFLPKLCCR